MLNQRVFALNRAPVRKQRQFVLYWMQNAQRLSYNYALLYAAEMANHLALPLVVAVVIDPDYPEANKRHFSFMFDGLEEVAATARELELPFWLLRGQPVAEIGKIAGSAALVVSDAAYLRHLREWRRQLAAELNCAYYEVETDTLVPVRHAYPKEAYSAAVLRRPLHKLWDQYLLPPKDLQLAYRAPQAWHHKFPWPGKSALLKQCNSDRQVSLLPHWQGGYKAAQERLQTFLGNRLNDYDDKRNDPALDGQSDLSPYLHFGQISPLEIALAAQQQGGRGVPAFLEELLVRRELSANFTFYNSAYDQPDNLPEWAKNSLDEHAGDVRSYHYDSATLEAGETHDPYWNAAQIEMVEYGKMHGYMRMYWGKKILEWTPDWRAAYSLTLVLNNRYELDGRDANGYAGVAWCYGKHDRPWTERPVFGKIRYMNANGLKRKFAIDAYVSKVAAMTGREIPAAAEKLKL
jgi:deoxyribodipyrimidine photo-lyase